MKKVISYEAISNSGTIKTTTYYWNGKKFTNRKHQFAPAQAASELDRAKAALGGFVAFNPEAYDFGIK